MNKPSGKLAFAYATIASLEEKIARLEAAQPAPVAVDPLTQPHPLCRQRLKSEGKAYPRSGCEVCGKFAQNHIQCDAALSVNDGTHHDNDGLDEWRKP